MDNISQNTLVLLEKIRKLLVDLTGQLLIVSENEHVGGEYSDIYQKSRIHVHVLVLSWSLQHTCQVSIILTNCMK